MKKPEINEKDKKDFVAMAAHALKNPIASIKLSIDVLLDGDFGELNKEQVKIIERICQKSNSLTNLIDDLFNLAQINRKDFYNFRQVDIASLIYSVIDCNHEAIQKRGIIVKVVGDAKKTPKIMADKNKIFLAIQNIFDNAVKYSNVGGEVIVSYSINDKNLDLRIKDSGIGILDSEKDKVFTEFFRGKNAIEMQFSGSGLGLYISKDIIQNHSGKIWFDSVENKGSTFFVSLPVKQQ